MKRVLLLIKGLDRGGAEQLLLNAAPFLDRSRFHYEVAYLLPTRRAVVPDLKAKGISVWCLDGPRGVGWIGRLARVVRRKQFDLVHCHSPYAAIGARLALARSSLPIVYTEHTVWELLHLATYWGNMLTFPRNDHVFAVSSHVRKSIRYLAPLRSMPFPPIETLYHGIDPSQVSRWASPDGVREEFGIPADVPFIGTVSNLLPAKGHGYLLRAAALITRSIPDLRMVVVGDGDVGRYRRLAADLGLAEAVIFAGYRRDAPRIAGALDVFVLSSLYEGLSVALIEAMALGRPAVVTSAGGLPEVVRDGQEGLVVPPRDPQGLAEAIVSLVRDRSLRERMGAAARARAAMFDIRQAVRRMEEVYDQLLV